MLPTHSIGGYMADNEDTKEPILVRKAPPGLVMGDTEGELPGYPEGLSIWPDSYKIKLPKEKIHPLSELNKKENDDD